MSKRIPSTFSVYYFRQGGYNISSALFCLFVCLLAELRKTLLKTLLNQLSQNSAEEIRVKEETISFLPRLQRVCFRLR